MATDEVRQRVGRIADDIRAELQRVGAWQAEPPSEDEVLAGGAFGMGAVPFETWLQVVLVPRLRDVVSGEAELPPGSAVGVHAVREWDGAPDRERLIELLIELDTTVG